MYAGSRAYVGASPPSKGEGCEGADDHQPLAAARNIESGVNELAPRQQAATRTLDLHTAPTRLLQSLSAARSRAESCKVCASQRGMQRNDYIVSESYQIIARLESTSCPLLQKGLVGQR